MASRERTRQFNPQQAIDIETATGDTVRGKVLSEDGQEARLYCHSKARSQKEEAMAKRFYEGFEAALGTFDDGLSRPRTEKCITKLWERIGRLKAKACGIGQHYHIELQADESGKIATALTRVGTPFDGLWLANAESRPASGVPTSEPCMSAKPPVPSPSSWLFIALLTWIPLPKVYAR